jgi:hypothetical protein
MEYLNATIEELLLRFESDIQSDLLKYKNHVYRVFLNCLLRDPNTENVEKYAIAAVFHDIGIWTDHTIDYLDPSIGQLKIYLAQNQMQHWTEEISQMIYWHHKVGRYRGQHELTVENFRKADWTDVSLGLLTFGSDKKVISRNRTLFANAGFHIFLIKKILKNWFKNPFKPLPMFKI